jgi:hypothetical protein
MVRKVGNGENKLFWEENLLGIVYLKDCYNRWYSISLNKFMNVADVVAKKGIEWEWKFKWRRRLFEW